MFVALTCTGVNGQNWQTVYPRDTTFYGGGGRILDYYAYLIDSNMLRTMWADSVRTAAGGDSVYYFFRGLRAVSLSSGSCVDTMAPSWLGPRMIRKPDGTEHYFNSRGDTIVIRARAAVGDSWIIAKDAGGRQYQGTVSGVALRTVDGEPDSIKTIKIQALNSGLPVSDWYNGMVFEISKYHGWIKTLDLYRFPDKLLRRTHVLLVTDSLQHERLPRRLPDIDLNHVDLAWKYTPGNEFITKSNSGVDPQYGANEILTHDSVISSLKISDSIIVVTMMTHRFADSFVYIASSPGSGWVEQKSLVSYMHTDTVQSSKNILKVRTLPLYEARDTILRHMDSMSFFDRYFASTMCGGRLSFESGQHSGERLRYRQPGCWYYYLSNDVRNDITNYVEGFGKRLEYHESRSDYYGRSEQYSKSEVVYAKLPDCTWGRKLSVSALSAGGGVLPAQQPISIYPNPAGNTVTINAALPDQIWQVALRNVTGSLVTRSSFAGSGTTLNTSLIPAGIYFLEVTGREVRQSFKLTVVH